MNNFLPQITLLQLPGTPLGSPATNPSTVLAPLSSLDSRDSSFTLTASPADALHGVMGGLTLAAAVSGSPALARICSHPLFAGASLVLGTGHLWNAWGQVGGLISGGLLFLSSVSTLINGYSFYRGLKAGWAALKESTRLAVYDRAQERLQQVTDSLREAARRTHHPILTDAGKLALETQGDVKAATEHFRDLRDERPQRIEGARQSSLRAADPERASSAPHQTVRRRVKDASQAALGAAQKAALTARLVPATLSRVREELDDETTELVRASFEASIEVEKLLESAGGSVWQRLIALRSSKDHRAYVRKTTVHAEEAQRVASASPRNWVSEARGDPTCSPTEKALGHWLGTKVNTGLLYMVPVLATMQVLAGGYDYAAGQLSGGGFLNQLVTGVLSLVPAAVTYLYNSRQGSRRFRVSPAVNQEMPFERLGEPKLQAKTSKRLKPAVPPQEPGEHERYVTKVRRKAHRIEADLDGFESMDVPRPGNTAGVSMAPQFSTMMNDRERRFTPIPHPDPNRPYRYDHRPGASDTEERKTIRKVIKAMPLEQLENAIRRGDVTHVDLFNMIRHHPASQDGAVVTRPIEGKLEKELLKLAREADRLGIIRHFAMVKDLFPGVDGVVTAGSKTMYLTDLGKSPLVERLVAQGFIPIPCGLTAGANGPDGLYNGHGAVGHPKLAGYDTAGSSSAEAYLLGLEDFVVRLAIGTDTGGSITAPCGAVGLFGWVPEKGSFSRINMIPYAPHLDTPGVMGVDRSEVLWMARLLTVPAYQNRFEASSREPSVYYFEDDALLVSENSRKNFRNQVEELRGRGIPVTVLGKEFSRYREITLDLYQDSFVAAAMALMNPLEENPWGEPQRYILDRRLQSRLAKAKALLDTPDERFGNLFNRYLHLHARFRDLVDRKFPAGSVFLTPTPEAVALDDFAPNGPAGDKLDTHDALGGMLKNRMDRAVFVDPERRITVEGRTGDVLAVSMGRNARVIASNVESELRDRFPLFAEESYGKLVRLVAASAVQHWENDGHPSQTGRVLPGQVPEAYVDRAIKETYEKMRALGREAVRDTLKSQDRGSRAKRLALVIEPVHLVGRGLEPVPKVGMGDGDQFFGAKLVGHAVEVGDAVFGDDVLDVVPGRAHDAARRERGHDVRDLLSAHSA